VGGEGCRERLDALGVDRQAGRGPVPAEALEMLGAFRKGAVEVEGRGRAPGALPLAVGARDQHDRPVEALDEPRGDDADHALVPALVGEHVAALAALRLGPLVDLGERLAQDAVLDALALAVQLFELVR
jgi:hypothetical protein